MKLWIKQLSTKTEKRKLRGTVKQMIENNEINIEYDDNEVATSHKQVKRAKRTQSDNNYVEGPNGLKYKFSSGGYLQ
eukprot:9407230-Ditylum_brightwellii.AAC.1